MKSPANVAREEPPDSSSGSSPKRPQRLADEVDGVASLKRRAIVKLAGNGGSSIVWAPRGRVVDKLAYKV